MTGLFIAIGAVFLLLIILLMFRLSVLVSVLKGDNNKQVTTANKVNAIMFPIFFILLMGGIAWYSPIAAKNYLPQAASEHGIVTDREFWISIGIIMIVFVVTHIMLLFFPMMYQYREDRKAKYYPENHKLELIWTIIPAIVLTFLVFTGYRTWTDITTKSHATMTGDKKIEIEITGEQFFWTVRYSGTDKKFGKYNFKLIDATNKLGMDLTDKSSFDDFIMTDLVLPKGYDVFIRIRAKDVLHSVFLPHFRQKMDAVPGRMTTMWFKPIYTTDEMKVVSQNPDFKYELACTEICGRGHFSMRMNVKVVDEAEFNKWYAEQTPWLAQNPDYVKFVPENLRPLLKGIIPSETKEQVIPANIEVPADSTNAADTSTVQAKL